jgi:hypothetical protein
MLILSFNEYAFSKIKTFLEDFANRFRKRTLLGCTTKNNLL